MEQRFDIPILYIVFNRLDVVGQTFQEIKKIKPKQLFIASDGARNNKESIKVNFIRKFILDNIDWECEVKTLFKKKNVGVNMGTFSAIEWFFKNVKMGIILEDDCYPSPSFFRYCKELLIKYETNPKVVTISGFTPIEVPHRMKESYYFSKYFGCWGWACWRDKWPGEKLFSSDSEKIIKEGKLNKIIKNPIDRIIFGRRFKHNLIGKVKDWGDALNLINFKNHEICIKPKNNLISNLGFVKEATNTSNNLIDKKFLNLKLSELKFPLIHPVKIKINKSLSNKELRTDALRSILKRVLVTIGIIKYNYKY